MAHYPNEIIGSRRAEDCVRVHVSLSRCAFPLIYFRARDRAPGCRKRSGAEKEGEKEEEESEVEIFDQRRDAAVSFISRQEQDPRRSFRPRTGPSRDVIVALHLSPSRFPPLRCGPAIFFCSTLKPGNEGGEGRERKERQERGERKRGNGRLSIGVAKSNVAAPPRKLVAEKASAIYKPSLLLRLYNPERKKVLLKGSSSKDKFG